MHITLRNILQVMVALAIFFSCTEEVEPGLEYNEDLCFGSSDSYEMFLDTRDSIEYRTIQIGKHVWMSENLKYMPEITAHTSLNPNEECYYVYDYSGTDVNEAKSTVYYSQLGVLYNYETAVNVCPEGWRLPTKDEWTEMSKIVGRSLNTGYEAYENLEDNPYDNDTLFFMAKDIASACMWLKSNVENSAGYSPNSNNKSKLSLLPGGFLTYNGFSSLNEIGYWWTSDTENNDHAWVGSLAYNKKSTGVIGANKDLSFSVRCIKE
ncbi:MAG: FISUMP domain-containing protein [Prolixibacteraceae bacterium]|jgi:uncharacterized protein (TIGR02145 family)|nr:FISUMP domain-containing protein [Prolixibacteraceae bacterium]